jgi:hypothetical protein
MFHVKLHIPARLFQKAGIEAMASPMPSVSYGGSPVLTGSSKNAFAGAPPHLPRSNLGIQSVVQLTLSSEPLDQCRAVSTDP